jgi:hypothetical protein
MVENLSEINIPKDFVEPIKKIFKKKPAMLEEQIRDFIPCDIESKDEENENI